nr:MAG TPA: hypothetical protein [Caudoviricetes sp.]
MRSPLIMRNLLLLFRGFWVPWVPGLTEVSISYC